MTALIVGLNNPISDSPSDALVPWPAGCTGDRLFSMMADVRPSFSVDDYMRVFERRNLWPGRALPAGRGATLQYRAEGRKLLRSIEQGPAPRAIVLLGTLAWTHVLDKRMTPAWFSAARRGARTFWYMPHPSGRNPMLTDQRVRQRMGALLLEVAEGGSLCSTC